MNGEVTTYSNNEDWLIMFGTSLGSSSVKYWSGEGPLLPIGYGLGSSGSWVVESSPAISANTFYTFGIGFVSSGTTGYLNYINPSGATSPFTPSGTYYVSLLSSTGESGFTQWLRTRAYPPSGVMPGVSFGSVA